MIKIRVGQIRTNGEIEIKIAAEPSKGRFKVIYKENVEAELGRLYLETFYPTVVNNTKLYRVLND